jgi:serine phosphatase RsbU (regulator of sigma subunit)/pSer/pThr/pTyr-binding forkhead associated (FHA) protein
VTTISGARLTIRDSLGHRVIAIDKSPFRIGRRPESDLVLTGGEVSRDHAEIVLEGDRYIIRDRNSKYGTFVNGARVLDQPLSHRDQIECGHGGAGLMFLTDERETRDDSRGGAPGELRQVATLLAALRAMGTERVLDEVLAVVLDAAIETTGAERGFIMLADKRAGTLELTMARQAGRTSVEPSGFKTSRKIPEQVFTTGQLQVADLLEGDLPDIHTQTIGFGIRHVLCAPLRLVRYVERTEEPATSANIGVLYLDSSVRGRFSSSVSVAVEALATEAATAIENARLYREAMEKSRLDEELRTASVIQQALLPEPRREGAFYVAVGASVPSRMIGGDFFDYLDLSGGAFGFALGDVTGKGPPAALVTAVIQGIFGSHAGTSVRPSDLIALVNRVLRSRRIESRLATIFFGSLTQDGRLTYCNAAQNPPLLYTKGNWERLEVGGTLVGAFANTVYEQAECQLQPGDTVVLFSDGIVEARNIEGEEFGEQRIREAIGPGVGEPVERILDHLLRVLEEFTRGIPQADDLTAVIVRYLR